MGSRTVAPIVATALAAIAGGAWAQPEEQVARVARADEWNPAAADGFCHLRLYVDENARVELHGDQVVVRTASGRRSHDTGTRCNQPLPAQPVADFRVTAEGGRGAVMDVVAPARDNGFTAALTIDDRRAGGDTYEILVAWHNPGTIVAPPVAVATASTPPPVLAEALPVFDDARACQDRVRRDFLARNDDTADVEFTTAPTRQDTGPVRQRIRGDAWARNRNESRPMTYECVVNHLTDRVLASSYELGPQNRGQTPVSHLQERGFPQM
jgi:hypothetical protein